MKNFIGIFCLYVSLAIVSYAQVGTNSSHYQVAHQLLHASLSKEMFKKSIVDQIEEGLQPLLRGNVSADKLQQIRTAVDQYAARLIDDPELEKRLVQGYVNHFSKKELQELLNFYQSEIGQKYVRSQPQLAQNLGQSLQAVSPRHKQALQQQISEILRAN